MTIDHSRDAIQELLESAGAIFRGNACRCIFHDDKNASAGLYEKDGAWRYKCQACGTGGDLEDVRKLLGDKPTFASNGNRHAPRRIVCTYQYVAEDGTLLFEKVRYEPKDFLQRKPDGRGGWTWGLGETRRVLYNLPELIAATPETIVYFVEGEKDVDNLRVQGLVATCNFDGASKDSAKPKWRTEYNEFFRGRTVCLIADKDAAGRAHAQNVAKNLHGVASEVRVVEVPGNACKDASDFISAGADGEAFMALFDAAPIWTPTGPVMTAGGAEAGRGSPVLTCLADIEPRAISWFWFGRIPSRGIAIFAGRPGEGKGTVAHDLAARVSTGRNFPDGALCEKGSVILISAEDDANEVIRPHLDAAGADVNKIHILSGVEWRDEDGKRREVTFTLANVAALEAALVALGDCKLVIVDPVGSYIGEKTDTDKDNTIRGILSPLVELSKKYNVALLLVMHWRKSGGNAADDLAMGSRGFTGIARAVWHFSHDPDNEDRHFMLPGKNNLAKKGAGLGFTIEGNPPRIFWEPAPVAMTADQGMAAESIDREKPGPAPVVRNAAAAWLRKLLASGPMAVKKIKENGKEAGFPQRTIERAADEIDVLREPLGFGQGYSWGLPAPSSPPSLTSSPQLGVHVEHGEHGEHVKTPVKNDDLSCSSREPAKLFLHDASLASSGGDPSMRTPAKAVRE